MNTTRFLLNHYHWSLSRNPHLPKHNTESDDEQEQQEKDEETPSASKTITNLGIALEEVVVPPAEEAEDSGRERLKRHRIEVAGRVWIPEIWGQEELLKDWIDSRTFDAP
ncbi:protein BIC1-like [Sesbania bispinosa]|nr:protein BIC1-like [Sesbania bispinosa]